MAERGVTRRELLGVAGGFLGLSVVGSLPTSPVGRGDGWVTQSVSDGDVVLDVDWRATANGAVLSETQFDAPPGAAAGTVGFDLPTVQPGARGALVADLHVPPHASPARLEMSVALTENSENAVTEPESKAPGEDDTRSTPPSDGRGTGGELDEAMRATVRYGRGDRQTAHDGHRRSDRIVAGGSLRSVAARVTDQPLDADPTTAGGAVCVHPGQTLPVTVAWRLPADAGDAVQTDSVAVDVTFDARACPEGDSARYPPVSRE